MKAIIAAIAQQALRVVRAAAAALALDDIEVSWPWVRGLAHTDSARASQAPRCSRKTPAQPPRKAAGRATLAAPPVCEVGPWAAGG